MSQPLLEPGHVVAARYRIDKAIGRGGYGVVYCATRLEDDVEVALKLMHTRHLAEPEKIRRFQREAALVTRLHHLNVVDTLDYGHTEDGLPFIVFELLRGHSLKFRLRKEGALSFTRACQISMQVLRALSAAHALDIAHRDIKPANIYLCAGRDDDFVKVLDFGIAKALVDQRDNATQLTRVGQLLGTPAYMSPEQIKGGEIGLTCDLYSMGLVMSELLSGRKLIEGQNEQVIFIAHLGADKHQLSEAVMETSLGPIIHRAIEKDPRDRFSSAAEMLAAVEAVAAAERFGSASQRPAESASPPSGLALLKETVRTPADPPPAGQPHLAQLQATVRTADPASSPPLANLQETVRMDPNVSIDDILRQHGIEVPPVGASTTPRDAPTSPRGAPPAAAMMPAAARASLQVAPPAPAAARPSLQVAPPAPAAARPSLQVAPPAPTDAPDSPQIAPPAPAARGLTAPRSRETRRARVAWVVVGVALLAACAAALALSWLHGG